MGTLLFVFSSKSAGLPLTQKQATIGAIVIFLLFVLINTLNYFSLRSKLHILNEGLKREIIELKKIILIQAGQLEK